MGNVNGRTEEATDPELIEIEKQLTETREKLARLNAPKSNRRHKVFEKKIINARAAKQDAIAEAYAKQLQTEKAYQHLSRTYTRNYLNNPQIKKENKNKALQNLQNASRNANSAYSNARRVIKEAEERKKEAEEYVANLGLSNVIRTEIVSKIIQLLEERDEQIRAKSTNSTNVQNEKPLRELYAQQIQNMLSQSKKGGGSRKRSARSKRKTHHKRNTHRRKTHRR